MNLGKHAPFVTFKTRKDSEWVDVNSDDLFAFKRIVIFGLPGAFTPICDSSHLPEYEALYDEFIESGIDDVYCVAMNDAFVMNAWAKSLNIEKVKMIPDGNGEFTYGLGMLVSKNNIGFGNRSWRYAAVVNNKIIDGWWQEEGMEDNCTLDPFESTDARQVLNWIQNTPQRGA